MGPATIRLTFHLILHTHWDREWYLPRAALLPRLVDTAGDVLDLLERDPTSRFVMDGQTVLLEDVLAVVPRWTPRATALAAQRRLEVGPWYVLADELIPTGESLVRNLLEGSRGATKLGSRMDVLYSPDAFGHPAIIPALAHEFGCRAAVLWRGHGAATGSGRDLFEWRGTDGRKILVYHLPRPGYEIAADLAGSLESIAGAWRSIRPQLTERAVTSHVAVFIGADHHGPPRAPSTIRAAVQDLEPGHIARLSSLGEYFDAVTTELAASDRSRMGEPVAGELRSSYGYTWTLQGVHATRSRLKRRHAAAELLLQRLAEPLVALATWHEGRRNRAMLRSAWRTLLQCQFHDTLCGCCSDIVAREQASRLEAVVATSRELIRASLNALASHDPDTAREHPDQVSPTLLIWNPVPRERHGILIAEVTCFRRDIMVGPPSERLPRIGPGFEPFMLVDSAGNAAPVQVLSVRPGTERIDATRHYPDQDVVDRVLVALDAPALPGLGLTALATRPGRRTLMPRGLIVRPDRLSNRYLEVRMRSDGCVDLVDRRSTERYAGALRLTDEQDLGDSYTPQIDPAAPVTECGRVTGQQVIAKGPLVAALETHFTLRPVGGAEIRVRRVLIIFADSPVLRVRLEIDNRGDDHRLRLHVPVGAGDLATAGAAFGSERRLVTEMPGPPQPMEQVVGTAPAHRFVAAGDGDRGLALLSPGFFEYEWTSRGDLVFTVQRSIGELSRSSLRSRPGHAGWPTAIPEAQERGMHHVELALAPLGAQEGGDVAALERLWEDTFLPLQSTFVRDFVGSRAPSPQIGASLEGTGLVFTSLKPAESGRGFVLRCYNSESAAVDGCWRFGGDIAQATRVRADETPIEPMRLSDRRTVHFTAPAHAIVTIMVAGFPTPSARTP